MRNDLKRLRAHQIKGMPVRGTTFFFSKFYQKKNKFFVEFFTGDGEKWSREAAIYFLFFFFCEWMAGQRRFLTGTNNNNNNNKNWLKIKK